MRVAKSVTSMLVGAIAVLVGCRATQSFSTSEFIGSWQTTWATGQNGKGSAELSLGESGKFVVTGLPRSFLRNGDVSSNEGDSGNGDWVLTRGDEATSKRLRLTFVRLNGDPGIPLPYGVELFPDKDGGRMKLTFYEGDPDNSAAFTFLKKPSR